MKRKSKNLYKRSAERHTKKSATMHIQAAKRGNKKQTVDPIPDTPENVAKALFGIKTTGKKTRSKK